MRNSYKRIVKSITVPILERFLRFLDSKSWVPVFYFALPHSNTDAMLVLHALHNIQTKIGRRVIVISARPNWPWCITKDQFFDSFIQGLNPKITYIFINQNFQWIIRRFFFKLMRILQISDVLLKPMGIRSTFRFISISTHMHTDILMQGENVVFEFPRSHAPVFEGKLRDLGISADDWFVCVHAREHGYYMNLIGAGPETYQPEVSDHRNVDIRTMFPAIEYIKSKGGIVVRMGDSKMTKVEGIDGLIDYPFTEHKSMLMDLYLVSKSRFILGCSSGVSGAFALAFGKPTIITNHSEPIETTFQPYNNFIFILKSPIETSSQRPLSLKELFQPCLYAGGSAQRFERMGYRWLPNSPDDILEATKEMLDLVGSDSFDRPRTREQALFHEYRANQAKELSASSEYSGIRQVGYSVVMSAESRISATFAARHFADEEHQGI